MIDTPPDVIISTAEDIAVLGRMVLNLTAKIAQERAGGFVFKDVSRLTARVTRKHIKEHGVPTRGANMELLTQSLEGLIADEMDEEILKHTNPK